MVIDLTITGVGPVDEIPALVDECRGAASALTLGACRLASQG